MKAVIFDMDGVLIDSEPVSKLAFEKAFVEMDLILTESIYQKILGRSLKDIQLFFTKEFQDATLAKDIITIREREFQQYYENHSVVVKPGIYDLLDYLNNHQLKKAVATSAKKSIAEALLNQAGLLERMDAHCYGSEVAEAKPHPELFLKAAERLREVPGETYVVEDAQAGIIAANRGGFVPIYIPEEQERFSQLDDQAYSLFADLNAFHTFLQKQNITSGN